MTTKKQKPKLKYLGKNHSMPKGNFTQVPNEILFGLGKYSMLKPTDVRIYAILLKEVNFRNNYNNQVDESGAAFCYMTQEQLGEKSNIKHPDTIRKSIERLEKLGLIFACDNGIKKSKTYFVAIPDEVKNDEKALVDVKDIGKKMTDEQKEKRKSKREQLRENKMQRELIKEFLKDDISDDIPDGINEKPQPQPSQVRTDTIPMQPVKTVKITMSEKRNDKPVEVINKYVEERFNNDGYYAIWLIEEMSSGAFKETNLSKKFESSTKEKILDFANKQQYEVRQIEMSADYETN